MIRHGCSALKERHTALVDTLLHDQYIWRYKIWHRWSGHMEQGTGAMVCIIKGKSCPQRMCEICKLNNQATQSNYFYVIRCTHGCKWRINENIKWSHQTPQSINSSYPITI